MPIPFVDRPMILTNPDSTTVEVVGSGSRHHAILETTDGYTVIRDPSSGFISYAEAGADGLLRSTGVRVTERGAGVRTLMRHVRPAIVVTRERLAARRPARWETRRNDRRRTGKSPRPVVGDYRGLCLLIDFPDVPATVPADEVERMLNQPGYTGNGNNGSVRDYFSEMSGGRLTYTNTVTSYFTTEHEKSYYADPTVEGGELMVTEALTHLIDSGFDLSGLSTDDEGFVRALNVLYAGPNPNDEPEGLWPYSSSLSGFDRGPGVKFSDYQVTDSGDDAEGLTIGTFCHENGHMICDFPDLYDVGLESKGAGVYCLMAYGAVADDRNPTQLCPSFKIEVGWATSVTDLRKGDTVTVESGRNDFFRWPRGNHPQEYFLIENRQQAGRDAALPDSGLAVWHIDESKEGNEDEEMTADLHYEVSIEQADGSYALERGCNLGDGGDLFDEGDTFADWTVPDSAWWDRGKSNLTIERISASGPAMTFTIGEPS
ncbi:M6 family metalloprotease domain-containing protein [Actinoplanes bogorensis]|uniref:M6 family metalloprotease domain-containing protein n=1 Tax=Paractinoplanes bogorensis TaxID=1610840 RepID=A0ABS5Z146_9ACTN|nr:M6 family metalloprotease domain-containing protein [Actinoplanes bogorensis]MBU2669416.1 M6 family metalloprotease domain-containing protein [Actinoplanes bogorensis]